MLKEEASWFGEQLGRFETAKIFPMCNVGSSTAAHRQQVQPWIEASIFGPARLRGEVVHVDIKQAPGVDIVGDLFDPGFRARLHGMRFRSVFCSNLLEHVTDPRRMCEIIPSLLPKGGLLFASCPYRYPYHPDPIDTLFRPGTDELAAMFPGMAVVESRLIECGRYLSCHNEPVRLALLAARSLAPFYRPRNWWQNGAYLPWIFRDVSAACVVLKKLPAASAAA
jgi:SAM-dependent methyltransferase